MVGSIISGRKGKTSMRTKLCIFTAYREPKAFELEPGKIYYIGRSKDKNVSLHHLKIQIKSDKLFIIDQKSKNGTFVNSKDISPGIKKEVDV